MKYKKSIYIILGVQNTENDKRSAVEKINKKRLSLKINCKI